MGKEKSESVLKVIKLSIKLGRKLQDPRYHLFMAYGRGYSHTAIAKDIKKIPEFAEYGMNALSHAVRYALVGNSDDRLGETYSGIMSMEIYQEHSRRHRVDSGKSSGIQSVLGKNGIHALDKEALKEQARKAAISRGETPWTTAEISRALSLSLLELFKDRGRVSYGRIADSLNKDFYNGKKVRNNVAVREAMRRLQDSLEDRT